MFSPLFSFSSGFIKASSLVKNCCKGGFDVKSGSREDSRFCMDRVTSMLERGPFPMTPEVSLESEAIAEDDDDGDGDTNDDS